MSNSDKKKDEKHSTAPAGKQALPEARLDYLEAQLEKVAKTLSTLCPGCMD